MISASLVKELRDQTGAGMMDCKRALEETGGDIEAARDSCASGAWRRRRSAPAARRPRGSSATASPTARGDDGRRRLRDRARLEERRVPGVRGEGARRGRRGRRRARVDALEEERSELVGKLGENIVVAGAARFEAVDGERDRGLRAPAGEQARRARAAPRRRRRSSRGKVAMHIAASRAAVDRPRGRTRRGGRRRARDLRATPTRCSRSRSRRVRRSSRGC